MTSPHSVLIVDDQAPFRMAVKAVLRRLPCFQLAGEASSGSEAIALVDELHPALVLMDINMPEMNGIEATRRIVAAHPDVVVFLCSTYDLADLPRSATESGASGYVNKERFGADALRQLWQDRDSGAFARILGCLLRSEIAFPRIAFSRIAFSRIAFSRIAFLEASRAARSIPFPT